MLRETYSTLDRASIFPLGGGIIQQEGVAWYESIDLSKIEPEDRYKILEYVVSKVGREKAQEALSISRYTLWRMLKKQVGIDDRKLKALLGFLTLSEFRDTLASRKLLESLGVIESDGRVKYAVAMEIIKYVTKDPILRQQIIDYVVKHFKEEIKKALGIVAISIDLKWSEDFEKWLIEKKSKPISARTLRDYRNLFKACLEGRELNDQLIRELEEPKILCRDEKEHSTSWLRQILRHYVRFLYANGNLDWDTYTRLLLVIQGRRYGRKLSQKPIRGDDVLRTLEVLRKRRPDIYTLYMLILSSGTRFEHVLNALRTWSPDDELYITYLARNVKRLTCFETHCRYYLGKERDIKPVGFMFFPKALLPLIEEYRAKLPGKRRIEKVAIEKLGLLPPSLIRTFALREMKRVLGDNDIYRFIVGKFGELTVSARHYLDLIEEADSWYPGYAKHVIESYYYYDKAIIDENRNTRYYIYDFTTYKKEKDHERLVKISAEYSYY